MRNFFLLLYVSLCSSYVTDLTLTKNRKNQIFKDPVLYQRILWNLYRAKF